MDKNEVDFITPLRAIDPHGCDVAPADWRKLALPLYALLKNAILVNKPRLIQASSDGLLEVYGGAKVMRMPDGSITAIINGMPMNCTVNGIAEELYIAATNAVQRQIVGEVLAFVNKKAYGDDGWMPYPILRDCLQWVVTKMRLKWWSRKHGRAVEVKTLMQHIWENNIIDRKAFGACLRLQGRRATIAVYNSVVVDIEALTARIAEAPNLAPLLADESSRWDVPRDPLTGASKVLLLTQDDSIQRIRETYLKEGWSPKGWRWLSHQGWTTVDFVKQSWLSQRQLGAVVNAMASAQVGRIPRVPRNMLFTSVSQLPAERFAGLAKCLTEAVRKRKVKVRDAADQLPLVVDYLRSFKGTDVSMLKGASWESLVRRQHEWHIKRAREQRMKMRDTNVQYFWAPLVQEVVLGSLKAISLNESEDLWEEGDVQGHCVGGYAPQCYGNNSRIYSIRNENGARVATLEVRQSGGKWVLGQLYGAGNSLVKDPIAVKLAKRVISQCNNAEPLKQEDNRKVAPNQSKVESRPLQYREAVNDEEMYGLQDIPF